MFGFFSGLLIGLIPGGIIIGFCVWAFMSEPKDRKIIEVGLKKILPSNEFVPVEWIYFHMELSPTDLRTLRHTLEEYTEEGLVVSKMYNGVPVYKLKINMFV